MATLDRPKFRPLSRRRVDQDGKAFVVLEDPLGVAPNPAVVPLDLYQYVFRHFDGAHSLAEIQVNMLRETGQAVPLAELENMVAQLDQALILDGPNFAAYLAAYRASGTRPAALAGRSYAGTERALRAQLGRIFAHEDGSGEFPAGEDRPPSGRLRGVLSPHIDFGRGGPVYTWAYRELLEHSDAEVFVILGVAHQYCQHRFALTRKDFETPLGLARTDRSYVDKIAALAGDHLFDDELAHRTEHSIEFQVVFLQYLLGGRRDVSIVPILVGSFHDMMGPGIDPIDDPGVARFVSALKGAEAASGKRVAYIGGIDLSHVGPEFGDPAPVDDPTRAEVRRFDLSMLGHAAAGDPSGWFKEAAGISNRWRVCGLAATYTMLHAMGPTPPGRVLRYDQAINRERTCLVSFASLAFAEPAD